MGVGAAVQSTMSLSQNWAPYPFRCNLRQKQRLL